MIVLDTCILRACGFGPSTDLLTALRATGAHSVCVPWMVLEELAAQKTVAYNDKFQKALDAAKSLQEATPWPDLRSVPPPRQSAEVREYWRQEYQKIVAVIPTSSDVLREAAFREANRLPPCSEKKGMKTGARDAAIWLSTVEYAKKNPDETVYFVSENTNDFGDGESYPPVMYRDIEPLGDKFVHLTNLDEVFQRFTEPVQVDGNDVEAVLRSDDGIHAACSQAEDPNVFVGYLGALGDGSLLRLGKLHGTPRVFFRALQDVDAYRVGETEWCTATARWLVFNDTEWGLSVAFVWEARVLVTWAGARCTKPRLSVLRTIDVTPPDGELLAETPGAMWAPQTPGPFPNTAEAAGMRIIVNSPGLQKARDIARRHLWEGRQRQADE